MTFRDSSGSFTNTSRDDALLFKIEESAIAAPSLSPLAIRDDDDERTLPALVSHAPLTLPLAPRQHPQGHRVGHSPSASSMALPSSSTPTGQPNYYATAGSLSSSFDALPNDLVDRQRLMKHITYLSSLVQRLQLELSMQQSRSVSGAALTSDPAVAFALSQEMQRRFDPIVAEAQISRLDEQLAQQSLFREADLQKIEALEKEVQKLTNERDQLVRHIEDRDAELRNKTMVEQHNAELMDVIASHEQEIDRLRRTERDLVGKLGRMKQHLGVGGDAILAYDDAVDVDSYPRTKAVVPHRSPSASSQSRLLEQQRLERVFFEMDETAARQDTQLEMMFFEPLRLALEAAVVYQLESERLQGMQSMSIADVPFPSLGDQNAAADTSTSSVQQQQSLMFQSELEVLRQQHVFLQMQFQRTERLVEGERQRNRVMAEEHQKQLEEIHSGLMLERTEYLNRLAAEVERAYETGRRSARKARREGSKGSAAVKSTAAGAATQSNASREHDGGTHGSRDTWSSIDSPPSVPSPSMSRTTTMEGIDGQNL